MYLDRDLLELCFLEWRELSVDEELDDLVIKTFKLSYL